MEQPLKLDGIATSTNLERLNESPQQNADRVTLSQQLDQTRSSKQTQEPEVDDSTAAARLYNRQISHCARTCSLKPRLHDTTGCQTGCQTGLTTGLTTVLNEQSVRSTRLYNRFDNRLYTRYIRLSNRIDNRFDNGFDNRLYRVYKHFTRLSNRFDKRTTGLTTGCIV